MKICGKNLVSRICPSFLLLVAKSFPSILVMMNKTFTKIRSSVVELPASFTSMKTVIRLLLVAFLVLMFYLIYKGIATSKHDMLTTFYYIGGILSGVFAFGAFIVASLTYSSQKRIGDLQRFETTLFNMLELQQQITNELRYEEKEPDKNPCHSEHIRWTSIEKHGRDVFEHLWVSKWFSFREMIGGKISIDKVSWQEGMRNVLTSRGSNAYDQSTEVTTFDHYFRHLYRIIKFIDMSEVLSDNDKYNYTSIVRATLSRYELVWLYYNCLYGLGKTKFKPLIEKYALLKNLRDVFLTISKNVIDKNPVNKHEALLGDYHNYLTLGKNDSSKYYIGAFYNSRDKECFSKAIDDFKSG